MSILSWLRQNKLKVDSTISQMASEVGSTNSHVSKITTKLSEADLIELKDNGNAYKCVLTQEGEKVADSIISTMQTVEEQVEHHD